MSNKGTIVINFGSTPTNEASVAVADATITAGVLCDAWPRAEATAGDHSLNDHTYLSLFVEFTCGVPVPGVGFTIYARSAHKMTGTWNLDWVWA
jgi:hypothetical protein